MKTVFEDIADLLISFSLAASFAALIAYFMSIFMEDHQ